ncbi:uncharacterized protein RHOBADRAFT_55197 [Rhodotorula graminis WP1]|uniref:Centrosomin N-terminal motif 1 domain-containing protein n=1 Tax=Rhodotorula graminis (strain WP1) TaxID=578459 RepID=A0A0P9EUZ1_RHOGW|nr:uncharacterized protein RHOBADRAFT_55197 [Rhodotorula graminis WP1]KPV72942.1 hypothetical protein RHOBADRAFT_55197 [Rhodotorula graminis WP1]
MDSSLASSTASTQPRPRQPHRPADVTLPSFAATFRSADYDQPPPGITHSDWARLANPSSNAAADDPDDSSSLLDEQPSAASADDDDRDSPPAHHHHRPSTDRRTPTSRGAPTTSSSSRPDDSASTAPTPSSADLSTASTELYDRTETTHLSSARLAADSVDLSSSTHPDDSSLANNVYGPGALGGRPRAGKAQLRDTPKGNAHGAGQNMTLREQEKVIDELKKDNFSLKLKLHFYEQRLERLAPSSVEQALRENIQLKVEFQTLRTELKRYKKLLLEGDRAIQALTTERDELARGSSGRRSSAAGAVGGPTARERDLEKRLREQEDARDQWERKARELHRDNKQLRADSAAAGDVKDLRDQLDAALDEGDDLRRQLADVHDELDDLRNEAADMRHDLADHADESGVSLEGRSRGTIRRQVDRLEQDNTSLRSQLAAQLTMLATRNEEADSLKGQVEDLKADLAALENELDLAQRVAKRADEEHDDGDREALEKDLDTHRDRATSLALELEDVKTQLDAKEHEIEDLLREIDERDDVHRGDLEQVAEEWREEVEGAREREAQARQVLEEKEGELDELSDKFEALVQQVADKDAQLHAEQQEVDALTHDLQKLGAQVFQLEEELDDKDRHIEELQNELDAVDKDAKDKESVHAEVVTALKEKLASSKGRLSDLAIQHETATTEATFLRSKVEDLALRHAKLEESSRTAQADAQRLRDEADEVMRALRKEEDEREIVEADLAAARAEAHRAKERAEDRERDVADLQRALDGLERSTRHAGDAANHDRSALGVELERAKRDLSRAQHELADAEAEIDARTNLVKEKDLRIAELESDKKDLAAQLASETQDRLALADKHDLATKTLRDTQHELSSARDRLRSVESQLNTDHRALSKTENQYRDQLAERNTLLLTVFQAVDRLGATEKRKPPSSPALDAAKPFSNFPVFHDRLLDRLRAVNGLQHSFERRTRELESKFVDQLEALKRQQDSRHKQLDRFEAGLKSATEAQRQWRARVQSKTTELEAAKAEVSSLQAQLRKSSHGSPSLSSPRPGSSSGGAGDAALSSRLAAAQASVSTLERRLTATQAQLRDAESRLGEQRGKYGVAEGKWEARVRELEQRVRAAEEKVKRERQGAKERMQELRGESQRLEHELSDAQRRGTQLDDVLRQQQQQQQQRQASRPESRQSAA